MAAESPFKIVFDSIKNLLASVTIVTLAAAACRYHQHLGLPMLMIYILAGLLVALTVALLVADVCHAVREIVKERRWFQLGVLAGVYLCISVLIFHAVPAIAFR